MFSSSWASSTRRNTEWRTVLRRQPNVIVQLGVKHAQKHRIENCAQEETVANFLDPSAWKWRRTKKTRSVVYSGLWTFLSPSVTTSIR